MPRGLLIFALCLPLAILLGFMLADPLMGSNMMVVSGALFALLIPIALAVHHRALIWTASAAIDLYFFPGHPHLWMLIAGLSFIISVLSRPLTKVKAKPVWDKGVLVSMIFVTTTVLITALKSGTIGMRILGSSTYGGRKYVAIFAAVIGFIALTMQMLPRKVAQKDSMVFALAPITTAFSNIAYMLGPNFYFLFLIFPVELAAIQAQADLSPALVEIKRISGFGPSSGAICMFCLVRWGIQGLCRVRYPWRMMLFVGGIFLGLLSGSRSSVIITILIALVQFFGEGLHRTRYLAGLIAVVVGGFLFIAGFSESLPLSAQRAISFLPVKVDPVVASDARVSLDWRFDMWRVVVREIPNHLWLGKGYAIDPTDLYVAEESLRRGFIRDYEISIQAGDYHSGPLSLIVPFGIVGTIAFITFFVTSLRVLLKNLRYGDSEIRNINVFLFSFFTGRLLLFIIFFGGIENDFWTLSSCVGLSLSINGGVKGPPRSAPQNNANESINENVPDKMVTV